MRIVLAIVTLCLFSTLRADAQRWDRVDLPAPYDQGFYLDIYFLPSNANKGWACDQFSGYVIRTTDGGKTWRGSQVPGVTQNCHLEYIQFFDDNIGYTSGPCGAYKSTDGGATWRQLTLPKEVNLVWGGWFKNSSEGWFTGGGCGYNGFIRTVDGGNTFTTFVDSTQKQSNLADPLWTPDMAAGEVLAAGNGTLWESNDDGATWQVRSLTGPQPPWHEEISKSGATIMVAKATSNCNGMYQGGGISTSRDNGRTWTQFETGNSMYGVYLINDSEAWAAGENGNVWQTTDGGRSWIKQNCGLGDDNMDDIFFIDRERGWVVGKGVYRLAGAERVATRDTLFFNTVCPDSAAYDTVYVINSNLASSLWRWKIIADPDGNFEVDNVQPTDIPACDSIPIAIRYKGTSIGVHEAGLEIEFFDPDTTIIVHLIGRRGGLDAAPRDTLLEYYLPLGEDLDKSIFWQGATQPLETISEITLEDGSPLIKIWATLPLEVPVAPKIVQMLVTAEPQDTGWIQARYRVRLEPCGRDTFITIRIYGMSPIITSDPVVTADIGCRNDTLLRIPILNTGNEVLSMPEISITGGGQNAYTIEGFVSGRQGPVWRINPYDSDTLLVRYRPVTGDDNAVLVIQNNDNTKTRGDQSPLLIPLDGSSGRSVYNVTPKRIDLGTLCAGEVVDSSFTIQNNGGAGFNVLTSADARIGGLNNTSGVRTNPGSTSTIPFTFVATEPGTYVDTILVQMRPCDTLETVIVEAQIPGGECIINPNPITGVTDVDVEIRRTARVSSTHPQSVTIRSIRLLSGTSTIQLQLPSLPYVLSPGQSVPFDVVWTPNAPGGIQEIVEVVTDGACLEIIQASIDFKARSDVASVSVDTLKMVATCLPDPVFDTVWVSGEEGVLRTMSVPNVVGAPSITVVSPLNPTPLPVNDSIPIVLRYDPTIEPAAAGRLEFVVNPDAIPFTIELTGTYLRSEFSISQTRIDFGTRGPCEDTAMRIVTITNRGNLDDTFVATMIQSAPGLGMGPRNGAVRAGGAFQIFVVYDPSLAVPGPLNASFEIRSTVCDFVDTVEVTAFTSDGRLVMTPDPVVAPLTDIGTAYTADVTITNPTFDPRTIVSLFVEPPSGEWRLLTNLDGTIVPAGGTVIARVEFRPTVPGTTDLRLRLNDRGSCQTSSFIRIMGSARIKPAYTIDLQADRYSVLPGTTIIAPIMQLSDVTEAGVSRYVFNVDYSSVMYEVDSTWSSYPGAQVTTQIQRGRVVVTVDSTGDGFGLPGEVVVIRGIARAAIPDTTVLDISQESVTSIEETIITDFDGLIHVQNCGPYNAISLGAPTNVTLAPPQPSTTMVNLDVYASAAEVLTVEMYDVAGNMVRHLPNINVERGHSLVSIETNNVHTGMFVVNVTTARGGHFRVPCLIVQ